MPKEISASVSAGVKYKGKKGTTIWTNVSYEHTKDLNPDIECHEYFNPKPGTYQINGETYHYSTKVLLSTTLLFLGVHIIKGIL